MTLEQDTDRLEGQKADVAALEDLVRYLTAVVVSSPLTDDEDKRELMRLSYRASHAHGPRPPGESA